MQSCPVWRMRVGIDSLLSSILAFSMELKRIQTPHSLFRSNPLQLVGQEVEIKFEFKFKPLQAIWQSLPRAIPEDNRRF